jgi:catechol 2,3-dioxygenase-like lactoylglutathione lyase family enzyme
MSTRLEAGVPILRIFDVDRAREFYVDWLGFHVDWEHRFDENAPLYMQVSRGGLVLPFGNTLRIEERLDPEG